MGGGGDEVAHGRASGSSSRARDKVVWYTELPGRAGL